MKRFFVVGGFLTLAALLGSEARAQTGTARGKVLDEQGQPLLEAKVLLEYQGDVNRKYETKTNKKGEFTQVGVHPGPYKITVSKEGYQGGFIEARISLGEPTYLPDFKLKTRAAAGQSASDQAAVELQAAFKNAIDLTSAGKLDEAEAAYKEILATHPSIPQVHYNLGYIYTQRKDWPSAEAAYKKALEIKPDYGEASLALARVYQDSGQKDKALAVMSQAGGDDPKVQFNLGVMHLNAAKYAEAEAAFKKAEALDSSNAEIQFHLASIALNLGKTDECIARLEKYLSMSPQNPQNAATAQGLLQALKPKK